MSARRTHYSYEDYLRSLELSDVKLEFADGVIYAMAGGTIAHAALAGAATAIMGKALSGSCRTYSSQLRVRVDASDLSTFPDVTVICGEPRPAEIDANAVTNPAILIEVTSRSTEDYDRGDKLSHYKQLPSLKAVIFISHRAPRVTLIERAKSGWTEREFRGGEVVVVTDPKLSFAVDELYAGIALDPA